MLSPYRVVDLTDGGAMICGQILGDLGADVILVEPSAGAHARRIGPYVEICPTPIRASISRRSTGTSARSLST
jgi:crotonobetainyl-CoA:carnitine CoA-transferase CaiB-like acyl-CoA transferase